MPGQLSVKMSELTFPERRPAGPMRGIGPLDGVPVDPFERTEVSDRKNSPHVQVFLWCLCVLKRSGREQKQFKIADSRLWE
jgi:hypothetical protein